MKKIVLFGVAITAIVMFACQGPAGNNAISQKTDSSYAIIGKVTGQDSGWIYLIHRQSGITDSAALDHGFFKFNGKADTAEICRISLNGHAKIFFLENGKISMLIRKDSISEALISGTKVQDEYNYFQDDLSKPIRTRMSKVDKAYDEANDRKDQKAADSLDKVFTSLDLEQKQLAAEFIKAHPSSVVSAFLVFSNFSYDARLGQLDSLYKTLDTTTRTTYYGRQLQSLIEKTRTTAIGNPAPDIICNDVNGKPVDLASFKGKYTLVDFWASWCGPCRLENPNIVKTYQRFHDKGFDIYAVSLDDTHADWVAAIKKDKLDWTQVSDLKGWQSAPADLYGVKGIPMNYLLDKSGIIIAKGLRGAELADKLATLVP
jgi:thiol-disulfide isomerase/thioredoxin